MFLSNKKLYVALNKILKKKKTGFKIATDSFVKIVILLIMNIMMIKH